MSWSTPRPTRVTRRAIAGCSDSRPPSRPSSIQFDRGGETPFTDFGGRATALGSDIIPATLTGLTWSQIAADLRRPASTAGAAILFSAAVLTAELCQLTGNRPAAACSKS